LGKTHRCDLTGFGKLTFFDLFCIATASGYLHNRHIVPIKESADLFDAGHHHWLNWKGKSDEYD
jgi:hypothetical protein